MIEKSFIDAECIYPNFPKPGINFVDIFPCLEKEPLSVQLKDIHFEGIVLVPEARGFIFYSTIAACPNTAVIPLRKSGKMPGSCYGIPIQKEYGEDKLFLQQEAFSRAVDKLSHHFRFKIPLMVFDDILATGGTALGIIENLSNLHVKTISGYDIFLDVKHAAFYMELEALKGRELLESKGISVQSVIVY